MLSWHQWGSNVKHKRMKKKNKMDHNKLNFLYMWDRTINVKLCRAHSLLFSYKWSTEWRTELRSPACLPVLYKLKYMTTRLDWCWQIALRFLVLSSLFSICLVLLAYLSSQRKLYSIKSAKRRVFFLFSYIYVDDHNHHEVDE